MTMMFEVDDLSEASPATVSWCGMVYMEPDRVGSFIQYKKWLDDLPTSLKSLGKGEILNELVSYILPTVE